MCKIFHKSLFNVIKISLSVRSCVCYRCEWVNPASAAKHLEPTVWVFPNFDVVLKFMETITLMLLVVDVVNTK